MNRFHRKNYIETVACEIADSFARPDVLQTGVWHMQMKWPKNKCPSNMVLDMQTLKRVANHFDMGFFARQILQLSIPRLSRASVHSAIRRLTAKPREVSKSRDWVSYHSEIRHASRQCCCLGTCQIPERFEKSIPESHGFMRYESKNLHTFELAFVTWFGYYQCMRKVFIHMLILIPCKFT